MRSRDASRLCHAINSQMTFPFVHVHSVSVLEMRHYNAGETITMTLMKKPRGSLHVMSVTASSSAVDTEAAGPQQSLGDDDARPFPPPVNGSSCRSTLICTDCVLLSMVKCGIIYGTVLL